MVKEVAKVPLPKVAVSKETVEVNLDFNRPPPNVANIEISENKNVKKKSSKRIRPNDSKEEINLVKVLTPSTVKNMIFQPCS